MDNAYHILDLYHTALRTINVETMKNVALQETQLTGIAYPNWILLVNIALGAVIVVGTFWRSVSMVNAKKSLSKAIFNSLLCFVLSLD